MRLYVGNLTLQHHEFIFFVRHLGRYHQKRIPIGSQELVWDDDAEAIHSIVDQHAVYGLISVREVKRMKTFTGLCYQIDKPIPVDAILEGIKANQRRLEESGPEMRKLAALAGATTQRQSHFDQGMAQVKNLRVEIEEVPEKNADLDSFNRTKLHERLQVDLEQ